jgi:very-short-patch-repair endonuclease
MQFLFLIIVIVAVIIWYLHRHKNFFSSPKVKETEQDRPSYDLGKYVKKSFLFDTVSEFHFFFTINDMIGADYCIFPQVNYSHLVESRAGNFYENRRLRSHIERKSADFVICDKKTCVPRLVIDLDGSVHNRSDIHEKDTEIDEILRAIGLPILRLSNKESTDKELVKSKVFGFLK